ncbi:unnamed protein product [Effrenium voratum]|uniref:Uncharacterized protein n=1 Tax=Effrenium voratum TaxID=2562239 RepID=A0AA36I8M8_9DINO|nr:unnamed protein product [Effrenium voratum]CAJ1430275.1 unnamed protein product [Effrenium voratum]
MTGSEYSSSTAASSDCRYERALRLAEARLAKAARSPAAKLEAHLHCEALQAKHEAKERARQEWLESFSMEKSAEFQDKLDAHRGRLEQANSFNRQKQEELLATAQAKALAQEAKAQAIAQQRAKEEAFNRELGAERDTRILTTITKATVLEQERAETKRRQQEDLSRRRLMVELSNARERAASSDRRRAREDKIGACVRASSQQAEVRRREKEVRFQQKRDQAEAECRRRQELMEQVKQLQQESYFKANQIKEMAWKAQVHNNHDFLRQELEALVPRLSSAPTTPRSPATLLPTPSAKGSSPRNSTPRLERFIPATYVATSPRYGATSPRAKTSTLASHSPASAASLASSSSGCLVSPRPKPRFGASAQSLGSTRASLQASNSELA